MLTRSTIKLFKLLRNVSVVLCVIVCCIHRVDILIVPYRYLSHQWIVVSSAISRRCVIGRFLDYLLFWTAMILRWTYVLRFGRLSHSHDIVLLKLISIILISWLWFSMYVIEAAVLVLSWRTCHGRWLKLSGGPLLILCSRLLSHNSILSAFALDAQRLIFELPSDRWLLLTLDDWSHLLIATRLLLWNILWWQLLRSRLY